MQYKLWDVWSIYIETSFGVLDTLRAVYGHYNSVESPDFQLSVLRMHILL